jgi:hypothetical protein
VLTVLHPYTSDTGSHDMRLWLPGRGNLPYWPHLRPETRDQIQSFAYLNQLTLAQWRETFTAVFPDSTFTNWTFDANASDALKDCRRKNELAAYSDEDLLTDRLVVISQVP